MKRETRFVISITVVMLWLFCYTIAGVDKPGCRWMMGGCSKDDDCCPKLGCKTTKLPPFANPYCAWDGTFGKK
ncbi:PREDICTED: toxin ICK-3-like [Wasmannia auropunctata]|uniref:toxin ICK-3-like n=1 Tax=Wasmannia auropunctata TaxID=64793 RepID=UPI0005EE24DB|nr:PREDICTED: toxin ICK-3-like [Wasmannia auropunctata]